MKSFRNVIVPVSFGFMIAITTIGCSQPSLEIPDKPVTREQSPEEAAAHLKKLEDQMDAMKNSGPGGGGDGAAPADKPERPGQ